MSRLKYYSDRDEFYFNQMVDRIDSIRKKNEFDYVLQDTLARYGLKSLAFMGFNINSIGKKEPDIFVTYTKDWIDHYRSRSYLEVDPVILQGQKSILPVDWSSFDRTEHKVRMLFNESREAGLGNQGLSIPVRGRNGDFSLFSLTCEASAMDWVELKRAYIRDFQTLAVYFHQSVIRASNNGQREPNLTPREKECLYWIACGKTAEESAIIMGISRRTVRFHIENILFKMNATNMTHAVAKAVYFQLINAPR